MQRNTKFLNFVMYKKTLNNKFYSGSHLIFSFNFNKSYIYNFKNLQAFSLRLKKSNKVFFQVIKINHKISSGQLNLFTCALKFLL